MLHYDLADIRKQYGISQLDLANRLGHSIHKIQYSETGKGSMSYSSLIRIGLAANMTDYIEEPVILWNGEALRDARRALLLSQKELAGRVGANFRDISRWETGCNEPRPDMVEKLGRACRRNVSSFYTGSASTEQISDILAHATQHTDSIIIDVIPASGCNGIRPHARYGFEVLRQESYAV